MKAHMPLPQSRRYRRPDARMLVSFGVAISILVLSQGPVPAATIYVASGTSGTWMPGQSYNETRAVDVTVLSPADLLVSSITLSGIGGGGLTRAVIYDSNTQMLIASAQGSVSGGTITLPISATLNSGDEYRIGFYGYLGNGTFFIPGSPPYSLPGHFPYTESSGLLRINGAWDTWADSFPNFENLAVPQISLQVSAVPEPGTATLVGAGLLFSLLPFKRRTWHPGHEEGVGR